VPRSALLWTIGGQNSQKIEPADARFCHETRDEKPRTGMLLLIGRDEGHDKSGNRPLGRPPPCHHAGEQRVGAEDPPVTREQFLLLQQQNALLQQQVQKAGRR